MSDYTMDMRLCDDEGMISTRPIADGLPAEQTSYLDRLNHLRSLGGDSRYEGGPVPCTGNAHLAYEHIRCTNPRHRVAVGVKEATDGR